ncbi:MAG: hypothetical protein KA436_01535 [Oligoflexales bacterium]|nr:hypothetical protein [Oligoflexales bacterium]
MKTIEIPSFQYKNDLGVVELKNIQLTVEEEDYLKFNENIPIENIDYGLSGLDIKNAEARIALAFFKRKYSLALKGEATLKKEEILAIQNFLNLNNVEFSGLIGVDKASLSNIYKRGALSRPVCLLILERLSMELVRPGSAKRMLNGSAKLSRPDSEVLKEVNKIRFESGAAA